MTRQALNTGVGSYLRLTKGSETSAMRRTVTLQTVAAVLAALTNMSEAVAQSDPAAEVDPAEQLFRQGLSLMKSDRCRDAIPLFAKSQQTDPAAATLLNLATCYDRIGKTASAYLTYQQAARAAVLEGKLELQQHADQAVTALAPVLTRLRVVPLGDSTARIVRINGVAVSDLREPILLDPGETVIEASVPGREPWRRTLSTPAEGSLLVIEVPDLRTAPAAPAPSQAPAPEPILHQERVVSDASSSRADMRPWIILSTGIGVAGLASSAAFALSATSKHNDSNSFCVGRSCTKEGLDLRGDARNRADLATWSFGFGLVSLATAGVLWLTSTRQGGSPRVAVQPWILPHQRNAFAGLHVRGEL